MPRVELREIDINVTNVCNLTCIYCSYSSTPGRDEPSLPRTAIERLLDDAAGAGTKVVHFSGGEPVIRRDMPDLIAHAAGLGFKMRMHSNGALLTVPKLRELWDAGLRQVLVSLDGSAEQSLHPTCAGCDCLGRCRGGSKALGRIAHGDRHVLDPRCSGDPVAQGYIPICFMQRENIRTGSRSGFAEKVAGG